MRNYPKSHAILKQNRQFIPGGITSVNRAVQLEIVFTKGLGAYLWDVEENRYIDYHAAFAPYLLGRGNSEVDAFVICTINNGTSLFGSGTTELEGVLAELICTHVPAIESVQFLNTGSEATAQAVRLARAATGRNQLIKIQGGYNGWHDDVSCNLMTPIAEPGPRISPGEYPYKSISAGVPLEHQTLFHPINYNDLDSVQHVCKRHPIAALITEPILQNIGIVRPEPGYLRGLRELADLFGFCLIFDEVKTGLRHAIGGYAQIAGISPDLVVLGKAIADGYPIAVLGGKRHLMDYFVDSDPLKRVLSAGTYNARPIPTAAAIATIKLLLANNGEAYSHLERLGAMMQDGLEHAIRKASLKAVVARQGSAFCLYFMDHLPKDWHDIAEHHDFSLDLRMRRMLVENGIYVFPIAIKQCSTSNAHTEADIEETIPQFELALQDALAAGA